MVEHAEYVVVAEGSELRRSASRWTTSPAARTLAQYAGAGASYVAIGVFFIPFMLSWVVGFAWLELWVWLTPAVFRRLRS